MNERNLSIGDGIRFGIGFILAPVVLALVVASCIVFLGSCGYLLGT